MYKTNEYMYWEYSVIISLFLKASLQESLVLLFVITLIIFFWSINTLLALRLGLIGSLPISVRFFFVQELIIHFEDLHINLCVCVKLLIY